MGITLTAVYPKTIRVHHGAVIEIDGVFVDHDRIAAFSVIVGERNERYELEPQERPPVVPFQGDVSWTLPIVAKVLNCLHRDEYTHLSVFPMDQSIYDYEQFYVPHVQIALPAYWKLVDAKLDWERRLLDRASFPKPGDGSLRRSETPLDRAKRHEIARLDPRAMLWQLAKRFQADRSFDYPRCSMAIGQCADKVVQAGRHLERLRIIDQYRVHLFEASPSDTRDYLLSETVEEERLIVEAAITAMASALDLLARAVSGFFGLQDDTDSTSFILVLRGSGQNTSGHSLARDYGADPLTDLWEQAWQSWVERLLEWRNYVIHRGCLGVGSIARGGVLVFLPGRDVPVPPSLGSTANPIQSGSQLVGRWLSELRSFVERSLQVIEQHAIGPWERPIRLDRPAKDPIILVRGQPAAESLRFFLDAWMNQDVGRMWRKLAQSWRDEWRVCSLARYIASHPLKAYRTLETYEGTDTTYGQLCRCLVQLELANLVRTQEFALVPAGKHWNLVRLPSSTFTADEAHTELLVVKRTQSGQESGYRDAIVSGTVRNVSQRELHRVIVHSFWMTCQGSPAEIGRLLPGESADLECVWKDAFALGASGECGPLLGVAVTREPILLRVVYCLGTEEQTTWADDFIVQ